MNKRVSPSTSSHTYIHSRVSHRYSLYSTLIQLIQRYLCVESNGIQIQGKVNDIGIIDWWRWRSGFIFHEAFRQLATCLLLRLLTEFEPLLVALCSVLPLTLERRQL